VLVIEDERARIATDDDDEPTENELILRRGG
jgi:hypothetical protein